MTQSLILPVETTSFDSHYSNIGPVKFIDYRFDDGSNVWTTVLHSDAQTQEPVQPEIVSVVNKYGVHLHPPVELDIREAKTILQGVNTFALNSVARCTQHR